MKTEHIADRLVELCRAGKFEEAQEELYADDAVSIEPDGAPMESVEGLQAIQEKGRQFMQTIEAVHEVDVSEPLVAGSWFSVSMKLDVTMKDRGRVSMDEICVYEVVDGRIASERFFYDLQD